MLFRSPWRAALALAVAGVVAELPLAQSSGSVSPGALDISDVAPDWSSERPVSILQELDGQLWGVGNSYRARFDAGAVSFYPASRGAGSDVLSFQLESVRLDGAEPFFVPSREAEPTQSEKRVTYAYAQGVREVYDVLPEGIEQSFVIDALPELAAGSGDLVVRGRLDTTLPVLARGRSAEPLVFERFEEAGVNIGRVLGIDADGRTAEGWLAVEEGALEMGLPAEFVRTAALPLTLDPLIGSVVTVTPGNGLNADVAWDQDMNRYLVTWTRFYSVGDSDIHGQFLNSSGAPTGGEFVIHLSIGFGSDFSSVADMEHRDRFTVVWVEPVGGVSQLWVRGVSDVPVVSPPRLVNAGDCGPPDSSGSSLSVAANLIVYEDVGEGIRTVGVNLHVDPNVVPILFASVLVAAGGNLHNPAVNAATGDDLYLVVWERDFGTDNDLEFAVVDTVGNVLEGPNGLVTTVGPHETNPSVAGDGDQFLVVYELRPTLASTIDDVMAQKVVRTTFTFPAGAPQSLNLVPGFSIFDPAVVWNGEMYLAAWSQGGFFIDANLVVRSLTFPDCNACEDGVDLDPTGGFSMRPTLATKWYGDNLQTEALVAWDTAISTSGAVQAHRMHTSGINQDLGGECGATSGLATAPCARVGNAGFQHVLAEASANATVYLVLSFDTLNIDCGTCTLVPNPFTGFVFPTSTDAFGTARVTTPLPNDASLFGLTFVEQWARPAAGGCSFLASDLSNAIRVTITE